MDIPMRYPPATEVVAYTFNDGDRVVYMEVIYRWLHEANNGHYFQRTDGSTPPEFYSHVELSSLFNRPRGRMGYLPRMKASSSTNPNGLLSDLKPMQKKDALFRAEYCRNRHLLSKTRRKLSTEDFAARVKIHTEMTAKALAAHIASGKNQRTFVALPTCPTGRQLRDWRAKWKAAGYSPIGFVRRKASLTGRSDFFAPEVCQLIHAHMGLYASMARPEYKQAHILLKKAVQKLNAERKERAQAENLKEPSDLAHPCYDTFREWIHKKLPVSWIARGRDGEDSATKEFRAVNQGLDAIAPMEQLQIDETRLDLRTILEVADAYDSLTEAEKKVVARVRLWVTAIIDVATRCIVALRIHHSPPSAASAIAALQMVTRDKTALAKHLGCQGTWEEGGNLELVSSDSATWLTSDDVHATIIDAGGDVFRPQAGDAPMRGAIERWFRTLTKEALFFWAGRTWGSVDEKGDADTSAKLCYDQAAKLLYRYLIDVYHNEPHYGLDFETPRDAWTRLRKIYKPTPPLGPDLSRHIFGHRCTRKLHKDGVVFLGIRYSSEPIQKLFRQGEAEIEFRVDHYDLGSISVWINDGWMTVKAVHQGFAGMSVWTWMAFNKRLRLFNKNNAEIPQSIALKTKLHLMSRGMIWDGQAELGTVILSDVQFQKWERKLPYRVEIVDDGTVDEAGFEEIDDEIDSLIAEMDDKSETLAGLNAPTPRQVATNAGGKAKKANSNAPTPASDDGGSLLAPDYNR